MPNVHRKPGPAHARLQKMVSELDNLDARVGFLDSSVYESGVSAAYVAVIMENGYAPKNIPPRPIFGPTVDRKREGWREQARDLVAKLVQGEVSVRGVMTVLAQKAAHDVQDTIAATTSPALKDLTIRARERRKAAGYHIRNTDKPLEATGYLYDSVTYAIEKAAT